MGISNDFLIACVIRLFNRHENMIWFNRLCDILESTISSRNTLSRNLDKLSDLGIITGDWTKSDSGNWIRSFKISDEAERLIDRIIDTYQVIINFDAHPETVQFQQNANLKDE